MDEKLFEAFSNALISGKFPEEFPSDQLHLLAIRGMLLTLQEDGQRAAIRLLKIAASQSVHENITWEAIVVLQTLAISHNNQEAADTLFELSIFSNNLTAADIIRAESLRSSSNQNNVLFALLFNQGAAIDQLDPKKTILSAFYLHTDDTNLRQRLYSSAIQAGIFTWAEMADAVFRLSRESLQVQIDKFSQFSPDVQESFLFLLKQRGLLHPEKEVCYSFQQIFFRFGHPLAKQAIEELKILPNEPPNLALFHFFSENWEEYQLLDFDHSLLSLAYDAASPGIRRRILDHGRRCGFLEWLRSYNGDIQTKYINQFTYTDWEYTLAQMEISGRWEDLWRLFPYSPPNWSARILRLLEKNHWTLPNSDELTSLKALANKISDTLPVIRAHKTYHFSCGKLIGAAISADESILAAEGERQIGLLDIDSGEQRGSLIFPPVSLIRALTFDSSGNYLTAASSKHSILIFRLQDNQLIKTFVGHQGLIRNLIISSDNRQLYSAGHDGYLYAWRFPEGGKPRLILQSACEIFSLAHSQNVLAFSGNQNKIVVLSATQGAIINTLPTPEGTTFSAITLSPQGELVAGGSNDGFIHLWNIRSGNILYSRQEHLRPITNLLIDPQERFLISADRNSQICVYDFYDGRLIAKFQADAHPITALFWIPKKNLLISAMLDGTINLWDFNLFICAQTPPSRTATREEQPELIKPLDSIESHNKAWTQFIKALSRWRQQYDIEIGEQEPIRIGEFDIELL